MRFFFVILWTCLFCRHMDVLHRPVRIPCIHHTISTTSIFLYRFFPSQIMLEALTSAAELHCFHSTEHIPEQYLKRKKRKASLNSVTRTESRLSNTEYTHPHKHMENKCSNNQNVPEEHSNSVVCSIFASRERERERDRKRQTDCEAEKKKRKNECE